MTDEYTQARLQRMEDDLRSVKQEVSVLSGVNDAAVKKRIQATFADNPRNALIYRGIELGMNQTQIAMALKERGIPQAEQPRVSETLNELVDLGFIRRAPKNRYILRDEDAYADRSLPKTIRKTLKKHGVNDL